MAAASGKYSQSPSCKADKDFMLEALKLSTEALGRADETIKSDKDYGCHRASIDELAEPET